MQHLLIDGYKLDHRRQYPDNTTLIFSNFTARKSQRGLEKVIFFGLQAALTQLLISWDHLFFRQPLAAAINVYIETVTPYVGMTDVSHIVLLHGLGRLPIEIMGLPEGSTVNIGIPCFVIWNTDPNFAWIVNYLETQLSALMWGACTSATTAREYRKLLDYYADLTCEDNSHVDFQAHDFSFRGMFGIDAAVYSGMGHLTSFKGTDTIPAILAINHTYGEYRDIHSVPATEHSVMCAGGKENEQETFRRLIQDIYPTGIVSIVSDTWDFWNVLTNISVQLKDIIMNRDGKVVFRPDSGDPADIICGEGYGHINTKSKAQIFGAVETLWDIFGGTVNSKGYKVLDPHVGLIYGDSITLKRAEEICRRLKDRGFASSNIVFGIGSYTYQHVTRDTDGYAMKATYAEIDGKCHDLFKDPITDDGTKKSAKGLLAVYGENGHYTLVEGADWDQINGCAFVRYVKDGKLVSNYTFQQIKDRIKE